MDKIESQLFLMAFNICPQDTSFSKLNVFCFILFILEKELFRFKEESLPFSLMYSYVGLEMRQRSSEGQQFIVCSPFSHFPHEPNASVIKYTLTKQVVGDRICIVEDEIFNSILKL